MELTGKVIKILDVQKFVSSKNGSEYSRYTFIVETNGQYPKKVAFNVLGEDKFTSFGIVEGGTYAVSFDIESREWKERWYTDLQAWRVQRIDLAQAQEGSVPSSSVDVVNAPSANSVSSSATNSGDDLPF